MDHLTPRQIVLELDKYIIGQDAAKRKVAIALRNRWRRQQLPEGLRDEVAPKNIIMIGPTGVGKTEIARRLSKLADAPFLKIEASKFTEVGYVGRDCESMIRELTEVAVAMVKDEMKRGLAEKARDLAERRLLDALLPPQPRPHRVYRPGDTSSGDEAPAIPSESEQAEQHTRNVIFDKLRRGELDEREIEIEVREGGNPSFMQMFTNQGMEELGVNIQEMFGRVAPSRRKKRRTTVAEARKLLEQEELNDLIDMEEVTRLAVHRAENSGIIFLDEIDKIASRGGKQQGPDVSREGVQRDILPIVEGSTVQTKYGPVRTDHILFIAAGAFHMTKVSDLIPELQGRFPIRVELSSLEEKDFVRILREPQNSLIKQYQAMLGTESVTVEFAGNAIEAIAKFCQNVNAENENIGARRLHTVMEYLLEDISFEAPERRGEKITIDAVEVERRLAGIVEKKDLGKYIL
jgi:ATP-dependent HslUV protease ATP-binding subunit HslU